MEFWVLRPLNYNIRQSKTNLQDMAKIISFTNLLTETIQAWMWTKLQEMIITSAFLKLSQRSKQLEMVKWLVLKQL